MGLIMDSQNILGLDYGSDNSVLRPASQRYLASILRESGCHKGR